MDTIHTQERKRLVERAVPKPVRKLFRWMNFHFKEDGRAICDMARTLPLEQREAVIEHGKDLTTARSKKNTPRAVRNVAASLIVGQGMWYLVCPYLHSLPAVRDSGWGWLAAGGLDKLFLKADDPFFQTGGASAPLAASFARATTGSVLVGLAAFVLDVAADFSRCFIEYWTQKKYGIVADGAARAYGQVRPFPARYSSLEAYQKIISQALRPWTLGTYNQIYNCIYGILGSVWRTGPQVAIVITVGRWLDKLFRKISEWTGLKKIADRMICDASERERKALDAIKSIIGEKRFIELQLRLSAESKTFWKWNPFRPAISAEQMNHGADLILEYEAMRIRTAWVPGCTSPPVQGEALREGIGSIAGRLESVFGKRTLRRMAPSYAEFDAHRGSVVANGSDDYLGKLDSSFGKVVSEIRSERELT